MPAASNTLKTRDRMYRHVFLSRDSCELLPTHRKGLVGLWQGCSYRSPHGSAAHAAAENLTEKSDERVGAHSFELLSVLGSGGEENLCLEPLCAAACSSIPLRTNAAECVFHPLTGMCTPCSIWQGAAGAQGERTQRWKALRHEDAQEGCHHGAFCRPNAPHSLHKSLSRCSNRISA